MSQLAALRRRAVRFVHRREDQIFFAVCGAVGVGGALVGAAFRLAVDKCREIALGPGDVPVAFGALPPWMRVFVPAAGGFLAGVVLMLMRRDDGAGHGVPEVMEVVVLGKRGLRFRSVLKKSAAALIGIVSGGSLGREGPVIQLATAVAARAGLALRLSEESYRILTAAGVAAGVAAAYHTPLAGTLFVVEIIVGTMNMRVLGAAVISALAAVVTTDAVFGFAPPVFLPVQIGLASPYEYGAFAALGVACGLCACGFMGLVNAAIRVFGALRVPVPVRTALGGLVVGAIGVRWPEVYGNGYEATRDILRGGFPTETLAWLVVVKSLATAGSVGSGVPGGLFTPTLMVGAALGGAFGRVAHEWIPAVGASPGAYALAGMGGALAGTMHAPLLATVMAVELGDNNIRFIPPLLVITFVSRAVARLLRRESIYTDELKRKGYETEGTHEARVLGSLKARDLLRSDVELIPRTATAEEVARRFNTSRELYLYVGDPEGRLVGAIDLHDVKGALTDPETSGLVIAQDLTKDVPVCFPEESIADLNRRLWMQDVGHLPVVRSDEDRTWLGIITRRDILGAVDREVLQRNVLLAPIRRPGASETDWFELPPGGRLEAVRVPDALVGRTVGESALGRRFGVTILAITKRDRAGAVSRVMPTVDTRLESGDRLVVVGPEKVVESLLNDTFDAADDGAPT